MVRLLRFPSTRGNADAKNKIRNEKDAGILWQVTTVNNAHQECPLIRGRGLVR